MFDEKLDMVTDSMLEVDMWIGNERIATTTKIGQFKILLVSRVLIDR